jgi:hypothetical protein
MKIPLHIAEKLNQLLHGEHLPASSAKHRAVDEMVSERVIECRGRIQKTLSVFDKNALLLYLHNKYSIHDLNQYISSLHKEDISRGEAAKISGNTKLKKIRTFKGFITNCYRPIQATIKGKSIVIDPPEGSFFFIYDFESFTVPHDVTIVGIENPENFRYIEKQKNLFEKMNPLFVSRYPQSQSKDMIKWLQSIPNRYLHFGDADFAGIGIYLHEYKRYLGNKALFFVPEDIEQLIENYGNKQLYNRQKINFDLEMVAEEKLLYLIQLIHTHKKGLEQEVLIHHQK